MKSRIARTLSLLLLTVFLTGQAYAEDSPIGLWKTIDDDGKTPKSHVQIFERGGKLCGKVVKLLQSEPGKRCDQCPGEKKDQPIMGMEIMWDLEKQPDGNEYADGKILDPDNGKVYRCKIWREEDTLKVRGYIAFLFRTQTWHPVGD
ncbi:MAG: DUF2147 domain-containing protein [Deltaproteobacteria bacterium]|nr:DUF2147 domain-containing protein [Deltaproteobacteria bacterium]